LKSAEEIRAKAGAAFDFPKFGGEKKFYTELVKNPDALNFLESNGLSTEEANGVLNFGITVDNLESCLDFVGSLHS
jgi:hypothetical protein